MRTIERGWPGEYTSRACCAPTTTNPSLPGPGRVWEAESTEGKDNVMASISRPSALWPMLRSVTLSG